VVRVAFSPDGSFFATASYDRNVVVYRATAAALAPSPDEDAMPLDDGDDPNLACDPTLRFEECHRVSTESNPEAMLFAGEYLLYTLRSSHLLFYLRLDEWSTTTKSFNPHPMDTHVSFSVLNLVLHPSAKVIACQTGDHRAGSGERILIYGTGPEEVGTRVSTLSWLMRSDRTARVFVDRRGDGRLRAASYGLAA
jgi:WD40 repeat protein